MSEYIAWYLVEIRLQLDGKLSPQRVNTIVSEVESHLRESMRFNMETPGVSEEMAAKSAIAAFGSPDRVAFAHLGQDRPRMFGLPRLWVVILSGLLAIGCWDFHWMSLDRYFDNFGATWQNGVAGALGTVALVVLFLACRGGYRPYRKALLALTASTAVGLVFLLSFWIVGDKFGNQGFSRIHLSRDVAVAQQSLVRLGRLEAYLKRGEEIFLRAEGPEMIPLEYRDHNAAMRSLGLIDDYMPQGFPAAYVCPSGYLGVMVDGRIFGVNGTSDILDLAKAKTEWKLNAKRAIRSIPGEREAMSGLLAAAQEARSGRVFFFNPKVFTQPVCWTIVFLPALLLIDAIAWAFSRRRPIWPKVGIA